jgi:sec-independent protein translocase protein TatA
MGIGIWELLIILAIVLVIFGAKRLRSLGGDLGAAIKNFRQGMKEEETKPEGGTEPKKTIEGEVISREKHKS